MHRPASVENLVSLLRSSRVVEDARLDEFLVLLRVTGMAAPCAAGVAGRAAVPDCPLTPAAVLTLMAERGLLTAYQAAELAAGRGEFWVGGYRVLDLLGRGGMGQVFLAEHALLGTRVAVKVLSATRPDAAARARFVREARAAAALDHPNIVRVLDVNAAHDPPYLVMEHIDGVSLQAAVARHGTFAAAEAAAVGAQIARGLAHAASVGLIHRDIKPANVVVDRRGGVKVLDLGIARFEDDPVSRIVEMPAVLGTVDYIAPEQAMDSSRVDPRADLYALGSTLYFLLAGHPPYPDDDLARKMTRKQCTDPAPLAELRPDVPPALAAAVHRLMARDPADRFQTAAELAAALDPWATPADDFPARLFHEWRVAGAADLPSPPTASGDDPCPTPLPPTRRILRAQTERAAPLAQTPTPVRGLVPVAPAPVLPEPEPTTPRAALVAPAPGPRVSETGSPTVGLGAVCRPPAPPAPTSRRGLWFLLAAAAVAGLTAVLAASF